MRRPRRMRRLNYVRDKTDGYNISVRQEIRSAGRTYNHERYGICRLPAQTRLRMPQRILRSLRHNLQNQGREPAPDLPCLLKESRGRYVHRHSSVLPSREAGLRPEHDEAGAGRDDAALPGNLFLRGLQRLHKSVSAEPEHNAVHRIRTARRLRQVRRPLV